MNFKVSVIKMALISTFSVVGFSVQAEEKIEMDTIVVIGDRSETVEADTVGSVDLVTKEEIRYERVDDPVELLNKVPGTYVSRYNQGAVNADIAIRGFAGDGVTPHSKLLIDGIPSNYNNGFTELSQLFPNNIESIEVFKGTSDPRYGLFNIAGNYNVTTRQDEAQEVEVTLGSYNTQEVVSYAGFETGGMKHSYSAGYRTNEGYRDHTSLDKLAVSGSWEYLFAENTSLRLVARHASYDGDAPGYLTKQEARNNPSSSTGYARQDGNDKSTDHISLHWTQMVNDSLDWSLKAYYQEFERERWVRFSQGGSLGNRFDDQDISGLISTVNWFVSDNWQLDFGADYESQDVVEQRYSTVNNTRVRNSSTRNREYTLNALGLYTQLHHYPTDTLRWNVALRADRISGDYADLNNGVKRDAFDYGTIVQPKFNIVYSASDTVDVFANAGRTFQHLTGGSAYTGGGTSAEPSINDGWELGVQVDVSEALLARISYWEQLASDEFAYDANSNLVNVGETKRNGIDLAMNGEVTEDLSYWGSFTVLDTKVVNTAGAQTTVGNEVFGIPGYTIALGVDYQVSSVLTVRANIDSQDDYFVNARNEGGKFGQYTTLNASANYDTSWGELQFQLNNITDEYSEYVYDFSSDGSATIHSPGDGVNGSISAKIDF